MSGVGPGNKLSESAIQLLQDLIKLQSFSGEEQDTARCLKDYLESFGHKVFQKHHNIWVYSHNHPPDAPVVLLNSHHDTVRPVEGWTKDPFHPLINEGRLFGLGSNDAGGALVALTATFIYLSNQPEIPFKLILAATAEEEVSGKSGVSSILDELGQIELGLVGEPTEMDMAIAEKGLVVLDCTATGESGHAARNEGVNAIYRAIRDIELIRQFNFPKESSLLGPVKMSVTQISSGQQHNVTPDRCKFVVDIRTNEYYSNREVVEILQSQLLADVVPRSLRLNSSRIDHDHPVIKCGEQLGLSTFGSPTLSDQALMGFPTLKIGPGSSSRSHTADEYILISEIEEGINTYIDLLLMLDLN